MTSLITILTGATASGKSAIALEIAQKKGGVIINADSQQMYKELCILTARPTTEEEARVPHKLYGMLSVTEHCSAGAWLKYAKMEIDWALSQGKMPVVVGGTGLYIKALIEGIAEIPDIPPEVRQQSINDYEQMGKEDFAERLKAVDPEFFTRLKVYDKQRLVRAYEVWLASGKPLSWWQKQGAKSHYSIDKFKLFVVDIPRDELYRRCDARFAHMVEQGAVEEVRQLLNMKLSKDLPAMKSVGIKELGTYLAGEITLEEAIEKAQQATRNYAKRQLTWFRHQLPQAQRIQSSAEIPNLY